MGVQPALTRFAVVRCVPAMGQAKAASPVISIRIGAALEHALPPFPKSLAHGAGRRIAGRATSMPEAVADERRNV